VSIHTPHQSTTTPHLTTYLRLCLVHTPNPPSTMQLGALIVARLLNSLPALHGLIAASHFVGSNPSGSGGAACEAVGMPGRVRAREGQGGDQGPVSEWPVGAAVR
jgi:hypothetical protein